MAFDIGDKRIGIAATDLVLGIPMPLETYHRKGLKTDVVRLSERAKELNASLIVCGLPLNADGTESVQTLKTRKFIEELRAVCDIEIAEADERYSSMMAEEILLQSDMSREKRKLVIDKIAASYILDFYLKQIKGE